MLLPLLQSTCVFQLRWLPVADLSQRTALTTFLWVFGYHFCQALLGRTAMGGAAIVVRRCHVGGLWRVF
jgi:hypothetical protein